MWSPDSEQSRVSIDLVLDVVSNQQVRLLEPLNTQYDSNCLPEIFIGSVGSLHLVVVTGTLTWFIDRSLLIQDDVCQICRAPRPSEDDSIGGSPIGFGAFRLLVDPCRVTVNVLLLALHAKMLSCHSC